MKIEQAVFTSARTARMDGYQLVSVSPGLTDEDAHDIAGWGPTHDSLLDSAGSQGSVNFHRLESGVFCVSRSLSAGSEYSRRGAMRIYTQCLLVQPDALARFANDPFRVLEAVAASGECCVLQNPPAELATIKLHGGASTLDRETLRKLLQTLGPTELTLLLQAAVASDSLVIGGAGDPRRLFAGLLNLFPPVVRSQLTFSTGLKRAARRGFRWQVAPDDSLEQSRLARSPEVALWQLGRAEGNRPTPTDGWAGLVGPFLASGRLDALAELLQQFQEVAEVERLDELANDFRRNGQPSRGAPAQRFSPSPDGEDNIQRAHAPHHHTTPQATGGAGLCASAPRAAAPPHPAGLLDLACDALMGDLNQLDDAVYAALQGEADALEIVRNVWPRILRQVGPDLIDETREHYLRYALSAWQQQAGDFAHRNPQVAATAMEVLCLLFGANDEA